KKDGLKVTGDLKINDPKMLADQIMAMLAKVETQPPAASSNLGTGWGEQVRPITTPTRDTAHTQGGIGKASQEIEGGQGGDSSSSSAISEKVGGIDLRVMNIVTQPMTGLNSLNLKLPVLANLAEYNLDEEFQQIQKMLQAGIAPSGDRIKEYLAACKQKGEWNNRIADVVGCLAEICRIEEDNVSEVSPGIKEAILLADSVEVSG
ncbi:MAG: hypothetical protein HY761_10315, partial [Candidatus Omnitrophica bacterium]|nr:hypothetical protein [Candidatus Omnitrophota bacterium]